MASLGIVTEEHLYLSSSRERPVRFEDSMLYDWVIPLLRRIEPERSHSIGMFLMKFLREQKFGNISLSVKTKFGIIKNPIGLAAGFDKTGRHLSTLEKLGFGYLVTGTITSKPWKGHPKPRIVRNPAQKTLVNCLGFPNPGAYAFIENIRKQKITVPIIASISGQTEDSILECYEKIQPFVSGIEVNLSSPNTERLKDLREIESFDNLAKKLITSKKKPTYLKTPPFYNEEQSQKNLKLIKKWSDFGFEGVTSGNSIPVVEPRLSIGSGGLSGPPLFKYTVDAIAQIKEMVREDFEINSVGGISTANEARQILDQGAKTIQIFTSLAYDGPKLIGQLLNGLNDSRDSKKEISRIEI
jgi:dihydroorotate dehydrogenase